MKLGTKSVEALLRHSRGKVTTALKRLRRPEAAVGVVKSSLGDLLVAMSRRGVALTHYIHDDRDIAATLANLRLQFDPVEDQRTVREVGKEVSRYVAGDAKALRQHVDLTLAGNAFQKKVLDGLQTVPRGAVVSYQALGAAVGAAKAARAVGNALHNNPVPIYIPCHRVIASDGRIGGYVGGDCTQTATAAERGLCGGWRYRKHFQYYSVGSQRNENILQTGLPHRRTWRSCAARFFRQS